jgi:hypothetical protein
MGKNNKQRNMVPERRNYKLYKAKKQWITACATFLLTFGVTAVASNASAQADTTAQTSSNPQTVEVGSSSTAVSGSQVTLSTSTPTIDSAAANNTNSAASAKSAATASTAPATANTSANSASTKVDSASVKSVAAASTATTEKANAAQENDATSSKTPVPVMPHATASENVAPIVYTEDEGASANVASTLTNADAVKFLKNGQALLDAGATIAWDGTPDTGNQADYVSGNIADGSGKIKVTYKDGTSKTVDVTFMLNAQVGLRQAANGTKSYYYVKNVGDKVTSMDTPDSNGYVLYDPNDALNPNDPHGLITFGQSYAGQGAMPQITAKLLHPLDTSTIGIHWAEVAINDTTSTGVTDGFSNTVGTYTIKVPYIVKGLKLMDNLPEENGTPVINA